MTAPLNLKRGTAIRRVLVELGGGPATATELAKLLQLRSGIYNHLNRLEGAGFVSRSYGERSWVWDLTDAGYARLCELRRAA